MRYTKAFSLIEVLISLMILSLGLLGFLKLQATSMRYAYSAWLFTLAQTQIVNATTIIAQTNPTKENEWNQLNQQLLPKGNGKIITSPSRQNIQITWIEPQGEHHISLQN